MATAPAIASGRNGTYRMPRATGSGTLRDAHYRHILVDADGVLDRTYPAVPTARTGALAGAARRSPAWDSARRVGMGAAGCSCVSVVCLRRR